jgi:hypothetical protein
MHENADKQWNEIRKTIQNVVAQLRKKLDLEKE